MDQDRLDTAEARRNQSPTTSRDKRAAATTARSKLREQLSLEESQDKRAAATTARSKLREQLSPEESQEEKKKNALSKALKRKTR